MVERTHAKSFADVPVLRRRIPHQHHRLVFLYVFAKNERDNITEQERAALSEIGDAYMGLPPDVLAELVANGTLIEVVCDAEEPKGQSNSR
jgi:hypothetical protein